MNSQLCETLRGESSYEIWSLRDDLKLQQSMSEAVHVDFQKSGQVQWTKFSKFVLRPNAFEASRVKEGDAHQCERQ